jgi:hypothetical protein
MNRFEFFKKALAVSAAAIIPAILMKKAMANTPPKEAVDIKKLNEAFAQIESKASKQPMFYSPCGPHRWEIPPPEFCAEFRRKYGHYSDYPSFEDWAKNMRKAVLEEKRKSGFNNDAVEDYAMKEVNGIMRMRVKVQIPEEI